MNDRAQREDADNGPAVHRGPAVVGIGASAGGIAALTELFGRVPEDTGLAFVVVVHLSPEHESHLAELLQSSARIPIREVRGDTLLEPDHAYVIPPNRNLSAVDTHLRLTALEPERRARAPIDHFFRTLARAHDGHAFAVVLSGTGSDGTLGIKEIKEHGGITIVQDPAEAEYDGMPQSALATGMVDAVLPLAEIPQALASFARIRPRVAVLDETAEPAPDDRQLLQQVFAQLRAVTGRDFTRYKPSTILRRIGRRMQLARVQELPDYIEMLRRDTAEVRRLADDLLITVTEFFRDPEVFEVLQNDVVPALFAGKGVDEEVRVWSVGCATGEEAYSLAMLLLEHAQHLEAAPRIQVFASDLHERSLEVARKGFYPGDIESVSPPRLQRFFRKEEGGYRVLDHVRELVVFTPHDLLADPPFSNLDLITCRNLLIYLQRQAQRDVSELFHYALRGEGYLLLGSSETLDSSDLFRCADKKRCLYRKRNVPGPEPGLPVFALARRHAARQVRRADSPAQPVDYDGLHRYMLEKHGPASMLVSPDDEVVHLSARAGRYLIHPGGSLTAKASKLVRDELRIELRSILHAARTGGEPVRSNPVRVAFDGTERMVWLDARPTSLSSEHAGFVLVIFDERETSEPRWLPAGEDGEVASTRAEALEGGAVVAHQRLQEVIGEYETNQEDMQASNEELQSANEELRSTMEELETSKEELQSMYEELQTVNQENRHKVEELDQLSGYLHNLLSATDIATLFLDRELRIVRFTPRVGELFNVRHTDHGRPISDITNRLAYADMTDDVREVLRTLVPKEREIPGDDGQWFLTRVMAYRSADDRVEGVVITFVDITERVKAEKAMGDSQRRFRALVNASTYAVFRLSPDWSELRALDGRGLMDGAETAGRSWLEEYVEPAHRPAVQAAIERAIASKDVFEMEHRVRRADGSRGWTLSRAVPLCDEHGEIVEWIGAASDITARRRAEQQLFHLNERLEELVEARTAEVRRIAARLTVAEHRERRRIAKVLHDDLQQLLYGVEMKLGMVEKDLEGGDRTQVLEDLARVRGWIARSVATTRRLSVDLSPPVLRAEGLMEALAWLARQMEELHGLRTTMEGGDSVDVQDEDLRALVFQMVRELLFNVVKHAGVDHARVRLEQQDGKVAVEVSDEGKGFDPEGLPARSEESSGLGLASIRHRIELMGGTFGLDSIPGEGARVRFSVPLEPPTQAPGADRAETESADSERRRRFVHGMRNPLYGIRAAVRVLLKDHQDQDGTLRRILEQIDAAASEAEQLVEELGRGH